MADVWQYITLRSQPRAGTFFFDGVQELVGGGYIFPTPDVALAALGGEGGEGWECICYHRNDGPRQAIIPMSLIQPPPWPVRYELVFKRKAP